jgi:hypothetical protein
MHALATGWVGVGPNEPDWSIPIGSSERFVTAEPRRAGSLDETRPDDEMTFRHVQK